MRKSKDTEIEKPAGPKEWQHPADSIKITDIQDMQDDEAIQTAVTTEWVLRYSGTVK
jgi:hypothetical protein